ncbi:phosphoribosylglycinamide formyltransferase [Salinisphaera sp. T31B1]|uniref:phosphoribosylglycinamide formyltransferase n=1 Tax=Salinisphaera sp. T31B1 TaxID=727963 RepID=UPI0033417E14
MTGSSAPTQSPARLVVVLSGRGRNLAALIEAIDTGRLDARIVLVVSNRLDARGLRIARLAGLPCAAIDSSAFSVREDFDRALAARIEGAAPDWVLLAGYMRILSSAFVQRFADRLINIHPSLLPRHPGLHTHARALEAGDARHGATVHFVIPELDAGPPIRQASIAVRPDDTASELAERLMVRVEQRLYAKAVGDLVSGRVQLREGVVWRDGRIQEHCPNEDHDPIASS